MQHRQIEIDVEVNRWIESKRASFDQTHNDILGNPCTGWWAEAIDGSGHENRGL